MAQPLPSLVGEGQGWGQYLIRYQDITDPTPPKPDISLTGLLRAVWAQKKFKISLELFVGQVGLEPTTSRL